MRRLVLLALLTAVLLPASPAQAKGPTAVDVEGPGVKVTLRYDQASEADLWRLGEAAEMSSFFGDGRLRERPALTEQELGPRYVLTWRQLSEVVFTQHAYPFAEGGAWVEVPAAQPRRYDGSEAPSGWISGGDRLTRILVRLGAVEPVGDDVGATLPTGVTADPPSADPARSDAPSPYLIGTLAACALAGFAVLRMRRRGAR